MKELILFLESKIRCYEKDLAISEARLAQLPPSGTSYNTDASRSIWENNKTFYCAKGAGFEEALVEVKRAQKRLQEII